MLRLYMDVHVHAAITAGVRRREIDVVTAQHRAGHYRGGQDLRQEPGHCNSHLSGAGRGPQAVRPTGGGVG